MSEDQETKLPEVVNTVCEFLSLKVSEDTRTSDSLSHQVQLKIESTRLLKEEYESRLEHLAELKNEQKRIISKIPEFAIELERELQKAEKEQIEMEHQLNQTLQEIENTKESLEQFELSQSQKVAGAETMFHRHKQLVQAWENALAMRIEPFSGYLKITYTDLNRSFQLRFKDSSVHIEQDSLPQATLGQIADQFNDQGNFAELAVAMRNAFIDQSSS